MGDTVIQKHNIEKLEKTNDVRKEPEKVTKKYEHVFTNHGLSKKTNQKRVSNGNIPPKCSLDKVACDIENILKRLNDTRPVFKKKSTVELKVEQKEFFRNEHTMKNNLIKKTSSQKHPLQNMKRITSKRSIRSYRSGSFNEFKFSKHGLRSVRSKQLPPKVPMTPSEMREFRRNVILNANQVLTLKTNQNSIDEANNFKEPSENSIKTPIVDVESIISRSLKLSNSDDFSEAKKIVQKNSRTSENAQSIGMIEQEQSEDKTQENEKEFKENEKTSKKGVLPQKNSKVLKSLKNNCIKSRMVSSSHPTFTSQKSSVSSTNRKLYKFPANSEHGRIHSNRSNTPKRIVSKNNNRVSNKPQNSLNNSSVFDRESAGELKKTVSKSSKQSCSIPTKNSKLVTRRTSKRAMGIKRSSKAICRRSNSQFIGIGSSHSSFGSVKSSHSASTVRFTDPMMQLRYEVNRAVRKRKTFTVRGAYPGVRKALLRRGWIEKYHSSYLEHLHNDIEGIKYKSMNELLALLSDKELSDPARKLIQSKLLHSHQVDFYWGPNLESFQVNSDKIKLTKINKFKREIFSYTSKLGLCDAAKRAHWFNFPGLARINHPRTYALIKKGQDIIDFTKDFRRTAAMSMLKWVMKNHETKECKLISRSGKVPLEVFQFAANECYKMVIEANNQDIDEPLKRASDYEWDQFLEYYYKVVHIGNHFEYGPSESEATIVEKSAYILEKLLPHYPHLKMDGTMNMWILKPARGSQGRGIHICRTLQYILEIIGRNAGTRYIIQKYIERPLLIFNTKFDIRQWFLISSSCPLTIWMYKECYLRFSSQTYNLRKLHESIHLTNNSVQQRYQKLISHDITLPDYNMWDSTQFKKYLSNIGYPDIFRRVIYKQMKECIIGAVMIHQDKIDKRKNCFELYGADFMLSEDFQPWLIEINSNPALYASTPITARMCPLVLEDTIKVIVDYDQNPKSKTGHFELIYRQPYIPCQRNFNVNEFKLSGKPLPKDYFCHVDNDIRTKPPTMVQSLNADKAPVHSKSQLAMDGVKETLQKLLAYIQCEKNKKNNKKTSTKGTDPIVCPGTKGVQQKTCNTKATTLSLTNLKSHLNMFLSYGNVALSKEDENLIDQALNTFKNEKSSEAFRSVLEIVEKCMNKTS